MPTSDPTNILLAHDKWAAADSQCLRLTCVRKVPSALRDGSRLIARHHDAHSRRDAALGRSARRPRHSPAARGHDPWHSRNRRAAGDDRHRLCRLGKEPSAGWPGHPRSRWQSVHLHACRRDHTHTMTHGMHHRAQCLNMLRHLGVSPLPPSSVVEWARMVDSQR